MKINPEFEMADLTDKEGKPLQFSNPTKFLVCRFIKKETAINWPREMGVAKRLWKDFPEVAFWKSLKDYFNSCTSLLALSTPASKYYLNLAYSSFRKENLNLTQKESIILQETLVGENVAVKPKKASLMDFIK